MRGASLRAGLQQQTFKITSSPTSLILSFLTWSPRTSRASTNRLLKVCEPHKIKCRCSYMCEFFLGKQSTTFTGFWKGSAIAKEKPRSTLNRTSRSLNTRPWCRSRSLCLCIPHVAENLTYDRFSELAELKLKGWVQGDKKKSPFSSPE